MHTLSGGEIRTLVIYLTQCAEYELVDLLRDNRAWDRDAAVALIEMEIQHRGANHLL
jgi:hypothetical protein